METKPIIQIAKCCGSCIHTNKPKIPKETHAAHYEVAKTERWCYKHKCNTWREGYCGEDWEGINKGAKTNFSRISKFNNRIEIINKVIEKLGTKKIKIRNKTYFCDKNWLMYSYDNITINNAYFVSSKGNGNDEDYKIILEN